MEELLKKYKDENGYIEDLLSVYKSMYEIGIPSDEIIKTFKNILEDNKAIKRILEKDNSRLKAIISKKDSIVDKEYIKSQKSVSKTYLKKEHEDINLQFYIEYIQNNLDDDRFLDLLPNNKDIESINIINKILAYYLKEINTIKYFLSFETEKKHIDDMSESLINNSNIYEKIVEYKNSLFLIEKSQQRKNEIIYYMNGSIPFVYTDIEDYPENYESIINLIESIEDGKFKNIKLFTNNDKLRGLMEVRDLSNGTRIIFEPLGNRKYCIIYAIHDKRETTSLYKDRLISRYKKYCFDRDNIKSINEVGSIKELIKGE